MNATDLERLQSIRARCVELLKLASKRTPGKWELGLSGNQSAGHGMSEMTQSIRIDGYERIECCALMGETYKVNAAFICACAGSAEASWRSTIAAIDFICYSRNFIPARQIDSDVMAKQILAAWEGQL